MFSCIAELSPSAHKVCEEVMDGGSGSMEYMAAAVRSVMAFRRPGFTSGHR